MKYTRKDIVDLLTREDELGMHAVGRALVALNKRQNTDEQISEITKYRNYRGFRPCDARVGTSMAKFYSRNGYLTEKQIAYWRRSQKNGVKRIAVYANQLLKVVKEKQVA